MAIGSLPAGQAGALPPATQGCGATLDAASSSSVLVDASRGLLPDAAQRALRYLEGCDTRSVFPARAALARLAELDIPMPDNAQPAIETLRQLDEICSPATVTTAGGRFFGFVNGGALPVSVASNWLATAWNQNTALPLAAPATAELERIALRWLLDLLGLPADAAGAFVTGTTMANFSALAAARHALLRRQGWDVEANGLFGAPSITVLVSDEAHPTVLKSLALLGLGHRRVLHVPVDRQGRMRADCWPTFEGPAIVCLQGGNVNTGAFDPFNELIDKARSIGAWVHVDGAFGLWARANSRWASVTAGIERADSWATDAHKWLNVPYDSGLAFVREADALRAAMAVSAEYLPVHAGSRTPSHFTPELSRRARGVDIWAVLRTLGRHGVAEMVEGSCRHARRFAQGLCELGATVLNDVVLNQVLVSFGDPLVTRRVIAAVQADGTCWCGPTLWQGQEAMRISVCSWATTDRDVTRSLAAIRRVTMAEAIAR